MSTLNLENIKHPDSASNNISVDSSGRTIVNGNMGIGTSSPTSLLHVQNTSGANIGIQATSGGHWRIGDGVGSTNGNLVIYDYGNSAKRMEIDSAGRVTMPYQPSFMALVNTGEGALTGAIAFNYVYSNVGSYYDSSNGRFTAPIDGQYYFHYNFCSGSSNPYVYMRINGSRINASACFDGSGDRKTLSASIVYTLLAGDYIDVYVDPSYGGVRANPSYHNNFSGYLLG